MSVVLPDAAGRERAGRVAAERGAGRAAAGAHQRQGPHLRQPAVRPALPPSLPPATPHRCCLRTHSPAAEVSPPPPPSALSWCCCSNQPRHGLLAWLQQPLPASLNTAAAGLTAAQVKGLAAYARRVSTSPKTVARILEVTGLATEADGNTYKTAEDLGRYGGGAAHTPTGRQVGRGRLVS